MGNSLYNEFGNPGITIAPAILVLTKILIPMGGTMTRTKFCTNLLLLLPTLCSAAGTAELRVTGTIVPDACTPTFSNAGVVQYETLPETDQRRGEFTILDKKSLTLSVSCVHSTRLTMKLVDNRLQHSPSHLLAVAGTAAPSQYQFGIKDAAGEHAGGYIISLGPHHPDSMPLLESTADDHAASWATTDRNALRKDAYYTWGTASRNMPGRVLETKTTLNIQPVIGGTDVTPRSSDGSATVELHYL